MTIPARVFKLSLLTADEGFKITGSAALDQLGFSVSDAGDVNHDGHDDFIVGQRLGDLGGTDAGEAYVIFGSGDAIRQDINLSNLNAADGFIIQGDAAIDRAGWSVSDAGDVNHDGIRDVIVGAPFNDVGGTEAGAAYVVFGKLGATRADIDLSNLSTGDGFAIHGGGSGAAAGWSVSSAGDVNGDGIDDILVGSPYIGSRSGQAYLLFGHAGGTWSDIDLTSLSSSDGIVISGVARALVGESVHGLGDVNNDGIADFSVGVPGGDGAGESAGDSYIFFGHSGAWQSLSINALSSDSGFKIMGSRPTALLGGHVSSAGDVNHDGINDMLALAASSTGQDAYVIYGHDGARPNLDLSLLSPTDGFVVQSDLSGGGIIACAETAGDVNGDGIGDLIFGVPYADGNGTDSGIAYVVFGRDGATRDKIDLAALSSNDGFVIHGVAAGDLAGLGVSAAGDINGDGIDDLIVGAYRADSGGSDSGAAYLIYGSKTIGQVNPLPQWDFSSTNLSDILLFAHMSTDGYNGDVPGGATGGVIRPPAGWTVLLSTYDGEGGRPATTSGQVFHTSDLPGFQATAYREEATGRVVISYRGTDGPDFATMIPVPAELLDTSIPLGLGLTSSAGYLQKTVDFYKAVVDLGVQHDLVAFTGHSLGAMAAGYMAGSTGAQAMIFDSGPHNILWRDLNALIDKSDPTGAYGFLSGDPDYRQLVSDRVEGEILGAAVDAAKAEALDLSGKEFVKALLALAMGNYGSAAYHTVVLGLDAYALARWGDATVEGEQLQVLGAGSGSKLGGSDLHSMALFQTLFYADHILGHLQADLDLGFSDSRYKQAPDFLASLFNDVIANRAEQVSGAVHTAGTVDAASTFREMVLAIGDPATALTEDVLTPLLDDAEFVLAPLASLPLGIGDSAFDHQLAPFFSRYFVGAAEFAYYSAEFDYADAVGRSHAGKFGQWLELTPAASSFGGRWSAALEILRDQVQTVSGMSFSDLSSVTRADHIYLLTDPGLGRSLTASDGNDLVIGVQGEGGAGDTINGAGGNDVIIGTTGNDRLGGGSGTDILLGGVGNDTYVASGAAGSKTTISDLGGIDALDLTGQGLITGFVRGSGMFFTDSLSIEIGSLGAQVKILDYYDSRQFDGQGFIEKLINGDGAAWHPTTNLEVATGVIKHAIQSVKTGTVALVTTGKDVIDHVTGTVTNFVGRTVNVIEAGAEDVIDIGQSALSWLNIHLSGSGNAGTAMAAGALSQSVNYTLTIDTNLDGITDATINLIGSGAGMSLTLTTDVSGTHVGFVFDPASQFTKYGSDAANDSLQGTSGADSLGGLGNNDQLFGRAGKDDLYGGAGDDTLNGGLGFDIMYGGAGNDTYVVDNATDIVIEFANEGHDKVQSSVSFTLTPLVEDLVLIGAANLTGTGNAFDNRIKGNSGANLLDGMDGNDSLYGGSGDDSLQGGAGNDILDGGAGLDTAVYTGTLLTTVDLTLTVAQSTGSGDDILLNIENVISGSGDDVLTGNTLDNVLSAGDGNDSLDGGDGNDTLLGGAGEDTLTGGSGDDLIDGGDGNNTALFLGTANVVVDLAQIAAQNTGFGLDTLLNIENVTSGSGADSLSGDVLANILSAGLGDDTLAGGDGNDSLLADAGNDRLDGGAGDDLLDGGTGIDTAVFSNGTDAAMVSLAVTTAQITGFGTDLLLNIENLTSGDGNDSLTGNSGANVLISGAGEDSLYGGAGNDTLLGGANADLLTGGLGNDWIDGGRGNDTVRFAGTAAVTVDLSIVIGQKTGFGTDTLISVENILSDAGDDTLTGNTLANILNSGAGNDVLNGGAGNDTLIGGAGADHFVFSVALETTNIDSITDFNAAQDLILVDHTVFVGLAIGSLNPAAFHANATGQAELATERIIYETGTGNLYFDADGTGTGARIQFAVLTPNLTMTAADFSVV